MSTNVSANSVPDLYCVQIRRHARDLCVSIVLPATSELMAKREAFRLFPEYKYGFKQTRVFPVRYVELDWDNSRYTIAQREERPELLPGFVAPKRQRKRNPRSTENGDTE